MEHDFLDLKSFVAEAEKTEEDEIAELPLLPMQEAGLTMGSWALQLIGAREGRNPLTWEVSVFYIYGQQDFVAQAAMEGGSTEELMAQAQHLYDMRQRVGRMYSSQNESGEVTTVPAFQLVPISEDQAAEVRFFDYKLPIVYSMCEWFQPLAEEMVNGFATHGVVGAEILTCPDCAEISVVAVVHFTGVGGFKVVRDDGKYLLTQADGFNVESIQHLHLICGREGCDYDECVDLNEFEVDHQHV